MVVAVLEYHKQTTHRQTECIRLFGSVCVCVLVIVCTHASWTITKVTYVCACVLTWTKFVCHSCVWFSSNHIFKLARILSNGSQSHIYSYSIVISHSELNNTHYSRRYLLALGNHSRWGSIIEWFKHECDYVIRIFSMALSNTTNFGWCILSTRTPNLLHTYKIRINSNDFNRTLHVRTIPASWGGWNPSM